MSAPAKIAICGNCGSEYNPPGRCGMCSAFEESAPVNLPVTTRRSFVRSGDEYIAEAYPDYRGNLAIERAEYIRDCLNSHEALLALARKLAALDLTDWGMLGKLDALITEARPHQDSSRCGPQGSTSDPKST